MLLIIINSSTLLHIQKKKSILYIVWYKTKNVLKVILFIHQRVKKNKLVSAHDYVYY
jgi:hypothetical protein